MESLMKFLTPDFEDEEPGTELPSVEGSLILASIVNEMVILSSICNPETLLPVSDEEEDSDRESCDESDSEEDRFSENDRETVKSIKDAIDYILEHHNPPQEYLDKFDILAKKAISRFGNNVSTEAVDLMTTVFDVLLKLKTRVIKADDAPLPCPKLIENETHDDPDLYGLKVSDNLFREAVSLELHSIRESTHQLNSPSNIKPIVKSEGDDSDSDIVIATHFGTGLYKDFRMLTFEPISTMEDRLWLYQNKVRYLKELLLKKSNPLARDALKHLERDEEELRIILKLRTDKIETKPHPIKAKSTG